MKTFSPHTRGRLALLLRYVSMTLVFPAHAGKARPYSRTGSCTERFPRTRGEGSWKQYIDGYRRYAHVFDQLKPGEWVQGELFCDRIGGNFKFSTGDQPDFRAFHASNDNVEALFKDANLWVPVLDIEWVGNGFAALEQADTVESQVAPGQTAEGIVWYFKDGKPRRELANRAHFKIVSNAFLTRGKRRK